MSELKPLPCPFCGGAARAFRRTCDKDTRYDPADRAFPIVRCGACGACSEGDDWAEIQTAIDRWNRRAQPAQAGQYTCQNGDKCKHGSWCSEVYCQELCQFRKPAQAGQVLTEGEIVKCLVAAGCVGTVKMTYDSGPYEITRTSINADRFARAIEQAVLAKRVPMTNEQITHAMRDSDPRTLTGNLFFDGIRTAERHHGIVGEKGGA